LIFEKSNPKWGIIFNTRMFTLCVANTTQNQIRTHMTKLALLVVFFCCCSYFTIAQDLDSLILRSEQLQQEPLDSNLSKVYYKLAAKTFGSNKDTCVHFLYKSLEAAQKINFAAGVQRSAYLLAVIYEAKQDYEPAFKILEICLQALPSAKKRHMRCLKIAGDLNRNLDRHEIASEYYAEADSISKTTTDTAFISTLYNSQAILSESLQRFDDAIDYYIKSAEIDKKRGKPTGYLISMGNVMGLYVKLKEPDKAELYLKEARKFAKETGAERNLHLTIRQAGIHFLKQEYSKAKIQYQHALDLAQNADKQFLYAGIYYSLASCYLKEGNNLEALKFAETGFPFSKQPEQIFNYQILISNALTDLKRYGEAGEWMQKAKDG